MTTLTKSWLQQQIAEMESDRDEIPFGLGVDGNNTIAAFKLALASMEAEPVAWWTGPEPTPTGEIESIHDHETGSHSIPLYAHSTQPAPVVPEVLPCPVLLEPGMRFGKGVRTQTMLGALQRRAEYHAELEAMTPEQRAEHEAGMAEFKMMLGAPAPVAMKDHQIRELVNELRDIATEYHGTQQLRERIARAVRAAILQAGNSPAIPDGWVACSDRMPADGFDVLCTSEFDGPGDWRRKVGYWHCGKWVVYGASWTPTYWMPLPAAPQQEVNREMD